MVKMVKLTHSVVLSSYLPFLTFYDPCKSIVVSANANSFGLGAARFQKEGIEYKPVA